MYLNEIARELKGQLSVIYNDAILIKSEYVEKSFYTKYKSWETLDLTTEDFKQTYILHNEYMAENLYKMIQAYTSEYNPIENFNSVSSRTENFGQQIHIFNKGNESIINNTGGSTDNTTEYVTSYDSNTFSESNKITQQNGEKINTIENSNREDRDTLENYSNTITENKSGNIGVTTSQQMIESEIDLRLKNIYDMYIDKFIKNWCYLII